MLWLLWSLAMLVAAIWLAVPLVTQEQQAIFLAGATSHGHYQIEMACSSCHSNPFGGTDVLQEACMNCHGAELNMVRDSHPRKKFLDPRNADRLAQLDARYCITCHVEHQLERTRDMGVTLPQDFCFHCHQDIAEERETHRDLGFDTCASSGCHNFHDNLALYEDFLLKHAEEPWLKETRRIVSRSAKQPPGASLARADHNATAVHASDGILDDWVASGHAQAGVNCSDCHGSGAAFVSQPGPDSCRDCHQSEVESFGLGKHGMRLAQGLPAMSPRDARSVMVENPPHDSVSCNSCHGAHSYDTRSAATQSCEGCHDSNHVRNYETSPHARVTAEALAAGNAEAAVTCATCHMPRLETAAGVVTVNHNQNDNLRPNEKMIRPVCMQCHGLGFAIDALADPALIENNFNRQPSQHVRSIDMALERAAIAPVLDSTYQ